LSPFSFAKRGSAGESGKKREGIEEDRHIVEEGREWKWKNGGILNHDKEWKRRMRRRPFLD
jgi:hypothetical protein